MPDNPTVRSLWRDAIKSEHGPGPTKRLILLLLADYMGPDGDDCFPSIKRVAGEAGIGYSTARKHVNESVENGWLERRKRKRGYVFLPSIPPDVGAVMWGHRQDTAKIWRYAVRIWRSVVPGSGGVNRLQKRLQRDTTGRERTNGKRAHTVTCSDCGIDYRKGVYDECPYCAKERRRQPT